ncbi:MAG: hypothetical protein IPM37_23215 [Hahellaceae bacterium]|nr:hypothetical protein [Hahellaceae bacterium]
MNIISLRKQSQALHDYVALCEQYVSAQAHLKTAQAIFAEAEEALVKAIGVKEEGTLTVTIDDQFKVSTTGKINRSLSESVWDAIKSQIPEPLAKRLVRYKPALDLKELRYIELNEPAYFALVSKAITAKPAKASVSVKTTS